MTESNVVQLQLVEIGDGVRLDADKILDAAKGHAFDRLLIVGQQSDGQMYVAGTTGAGESMILIELAKRVIVP